MLNLWVNCKKEKKVRGFESLHMVTDGVGGAMGGSRRTCKVNKIK
jgi:hypothetical protein